MPVKLNSKPYALIGNRKDVHLAYSEELIRIGYYLSSVGALFRSGGSGTSDKSGEAGVVRYYEENEKEVDYEVFLPWKNFDAATRLSPPEAYKTLTKEMEEWADEILIENKVCTFIKNLPSGIANMFRRNVCQIMGYGPGQQYSKFVVYYAKEGYPKRTIKGGTRIAVYLARKLKIPTFNIAFEKDRKEFSRFTGYEFTVLDGSF